MDEFLEAKIKHASEWGDPSCEGAAEQGFDAGYNYALQSKIVTDLVEALTQIRSGLTTDIKKVEYLTKKLAHEYLQNYESQIKKMGVGE